MGGRIILKWLRRKARGLNLTSSGYDPMVDFCLMRFKRVGSTAIANLLTNCIIKNPWYDVILYTASAFFLGGDWTFNWSKKVQKEQGLNHWSRYARPIRLPRMFSNCIRESRRLELHSSIVGTSRSSHPQVTRPHASHQNTTTHWRFSEQHYYGRYILIMTHVG
jgi:hypothetical protein